MDNGSDTTPLVPRQIWINPTTASDALPPTCTPFVLPSGGLINIGGEMIMTLTQDAAFQPLCPGTPVPQPVDPTLPGVESVLNYQDPFYSSSNPQLYAIAAVTVVSYMLVIILFITPRTFFVGGAGGGGGFLGQGGMVSGAFGSNSIIGVGSRPWLQKAAALAVAISLTIVTADTLKWAEIQYEAGYADATELTVKVIDGLEIRVVRVISETFLWLAQAQTLIRLFPRHKEKLVIKWTAFGLITLELVFSSLNQFVDQGGKSYSRNFVNAIPALDYLFALALNLCYAAFVIYYSLVKRRFAFWNKKMRNMPLLALLALTAVLIPVIFFILDLSQPNVSGWGSYVRWVGAAAASVMVWEWVERIEALERDEKKDGILGREIFDGDEMLENTPSSESSFSRIRNEKSSGRRGGGPDRGPGPSISTEWNHWATRAGRLLGPFDRQRQPGVGSEHETRNSDSANAGELQRKAKQPHHASFTAAAPVASPVSRTETASAASTVYAVRYHPATEPTPPTLEASFGDQRAMSRPAESPSEPETSTLNNNPTTGHAVLSSALSNGFSRILNPFRRQRNSPPLEVAQAMSSNPPEAAVTVAPANKESLLQRLRLKAPHKEDIPPHHVIVVPAPQQRRRPSPVTEEGDHDEDDEDKEEETPGQIDEDDDNDDDDDDDDDDVAEQITPSPHIPLPPPPLPEPRDSPPDAVLRAININNNIPQQPPDPDPNNNENHRENHPENHPPNPNPNSDPTPEVEPPPAQHSEPRHHYNINTTSSDIHTHVSTTPAERNDHDR